MAGALLLLFASLLVFLILTEIITVDIILSDVTVIDINFMIFAIRLTKSGASKKAGARRKKKRPSLSTLGFLTEFLFSLIKRCEITLRELTVDAPEAEPAAGAFRHGLYFSLTSSALAFASRYAKKFDRGNIIFRYSAHNEIKVNLDAKIKVRLLDIIISLVDGNLNRIRRWLQSLSSGTSGIF